MRPARIALADVRARLARRPAQPLAARTVSQAAVAILVAERDGDTHALLIQRAERDGDPWSGHMAFPGGRREPHDADLFRTAARETHEEVGVDIASAGEPLGQLDDLHAHSARPLDMLIRPYVCAVDGEVALRPNAREVRTTVWVPLSVLRAPETAGTYRHPIGGEVATFPAFVYRDFTIWGLTYRMITALLEDLG